MNPFEYVNAINTSKKDLIRQSENPDHAEKIYNPWITNKALSYHVDTIMYSNQMNTVPHIDNLLQNDYFLNTIRPGKRYSKWHKNEVSEEINVIKEYYQVSYSRAVEIKQVLTQEQLDLIRKRIIKGGNNNVQSKSDGRGGAK